MVGTVVHLGSHRDFKVADDPAAWVSVAETLFASATVLWEREVAPGYQAIPEEAHRPFDLERHAPVAKRLLHRRAFELLCGYAIENLLKACAVARLRKSGESVVKNAALHGLNKRHQLVKMYEDEGFTLSLREKVFLKQAQDAIRWTARYPVNLTAKGTTSLGQAQSTDWDTASGIVKRLVDHCSRTGS